MTTLDAQQHPQALFSDYVLGLLDADEKAAMDRHAAICPSCREAIERERSLFASIRTTVVSATRPDPMRLAALRPAVSGRAAVRPVGTWQRLAPVATLLLLILSAVSVQLSGSDRPLGDNLRGFLPAMTNTPTATATTHPTATIAVQQPAERPTSAPDALLPAPTPEFVALPTPIAALPELATSTN